MFWSYIVGDLPFFVIRPISLVLSSGYLVFLGGIFGLFFLASIPCIFRYILRKEKR